MSSETGAFYLSTVSGGTVVSKKSNGIFDCNAEQGNSTQHWTISYSPDNDEKVAFQNASNGQYLRATQGTAYGKIDTSDDKSWWLLEQGPAPGSCFVKSTEFSDAYLCNANGSYVTNNQVYVWPKQANWNHALTWYFRDADAPGFMPKAWSASAASSGPSTAEMDAREAALAEKEAKLRDVEQREAALAEKEQEVSAQQAKLKDIEQREAALAKKEEDVSAKQAKLKDIKQQDVALAKKEQEVSAQQAMQQKREEQLNTRERQLAQKAGQKGAGSGDGDAGKLAQERADLDKKIQGLRAAERDFAAKEAALSKREQHSGVKEDELKQKEAALVKQGQQNAAKEDALKQKVTDVAKAKAAPPASSGSSQAELLRAENENLKLQLKIRDLERQLAGAQKGAGPPTNASAGEGGAGEMAKLKDENARLKKLIAQQQNKPPPGSTTAGPVKGAKKETGSAVPQKPSAQAPTLAARESPRVPAGSEKAAGSTGMPVPGGEKAAGSKGAPVSGGKDATGVSTSKKPALMSRVPNGTHKRPAAPTASAATGEKDTTGPSVFRKPASQSADFATNNSSRVPDGTDRPPAPSKTIPATGGKVSASSAANNSSDVPNGTNKLPAPSKATGGKGSTVPAASNKPGSHAPASDANGLSHTHNGNLKQSASFSNTPAAAACGKGSTGPAASTKPSSQSPAPTANSSSNVPSHSVKQLPKSTSNSPAGGKGSASSPAPSKPGSQAPVTKLSSRDPKGVAANTGKHRTNRPSSVSSGQASSVTSAVSAKASSTGLTGRISDPSELERLWAEVELLKAAIPNKTPAHAKAMKEEGGDAIVFDCGHVAYPPPRKLNKGMIGFLYVKS